ncbi:hypothetical protein [Bradyrhizobium brasilense]|uniref:hypothetical protein n=1 Tax=Bradyrhizobium brasilense TaxID=1419277 RepID=UPI003CC5575D
MQPGFSHQRAPRSATRCSFGSVVSCRLGRRLHRRGLRVCILRSRPLRRGSGLRAREMTKWFDTNCHYMVPNCPPIAHAASMMALAGRDRRLCSSRRPTLSG